MVKYTPSHGIPYPEGGDAITNFPSVAEQAALGTDSAIWSSGARDVTSLIYTDQGWAFQYNPGAYLERFGPLVSLTLSSIGRDEDAAGEGYKTVLQIPNGFTPAFNQFPNTWRLFRAYIRTNGLAQFQHPGTSVDYLSLVYPTRDPIPTTLPGIPN